MTRFTVEPDAAAVSRTTADRFVDAARDAIAERGIFRVALSGGGTPKQVYPLLLEPERRDAVDWSAVEFFWGDERAVPPDHPESNFGVAYGMLISQLPAVRQDRIHRMPAEASDLEAAALSYETELRLAFAATGSGPPAFDLVWLGMGPDGHTASLFPGGDAVNATRRWVVAAWAPSLEAWRLSLTLPVLNAGRRVLFADTGADKADAQAGGRAATDRRPGAGPAPRHWRGARPFPPRRSR